MKTAIADVKLLQTKRFGDHRGFFCELYQAERARAAGVDATFIQDNYSFSADQGTLRGLHFQSPPFAQSKLVCVLQGALFDVAVDLRRSSPTFGQHVSVELSATNGLQLFVPQGFAHGFVTLEPNTHVIYKVDQFYAPDNDHGCMWNDPDLGISWPFSSENVILSGKDKVQPCFADLPSYFA